MGRGKSRDTIEVHEGLYLSAVGKKGTWQCYFRVHGESFRKSTKTIDLMTAKLKALQWFEEARSRKQTGQRVQPVSFGKLKDSYLDLIRGTGKFEYHDGTIRRHVEPFFGKIDDLSTLDSSSIHEYLAWRQNKGEKIPTPQTVNRENTVLRQLLRHAVNRKWLAEIPEIPFADERLTRRRRRHFTFDEYRLLHRTSRKRTKEFAGVPLNTVAHWSRQLLHDYILFLSNTGIRVDEAKTIRWRHIDWQEGTILVEFAGKTRSTRTVFARATAMVALKRIQTRRTAFLDRFYQKLKPDEKVFALPDGKPIASQKKAFEALLKACGFAYDGPEDRHTLTSLRHSYATFRLTSKKGKRASMRALAKQMGTSERMIHRHYGHDAIEDYREELVG